MLVMWVMETIESSSWCDACVMHENWNSWSFIENIDDHNLL